MVGPQSPYDSSNSGYDAYVATGEMGVTTGWKVVPGARTVYNLDVAQDYAFVVGW